MQTLLTIWQRVGIAVLVLLGIGILWMVIELARAPLVDENEQPINHNE
jgi:hypothetical protein